MLERDEIKKALHSAYPGPWQAVEKGWFDVDNCAKIVSINQSDSFNCMTYIANTYAGASQKANAVLIANAPTWLKQQDEMIERLLAEAERERAEKHAFRRIENKWRHQHEQATAALAIAVEVLGKIVEREHIGKSYISESGGIAQTALERIQSQVSKE